MFTEVFRLVSACDPDMQFRDRVYEVIVFDGFEVKVT